jgi:heme/copper-type cytochrome/quinol oxidase subunit 3
MALGNFKNCIDSLFIAIILGFIFIILQSIEYYEADYSISDGVYGSVFYMLTGLHGTHVIIGIIFLVVGFLRLFLNHFTTQHYMGLIFAIWY